MSSGSNAPRKPIVAPALFKASSRFLHGQGPGPKTSMKRQRPGAGSLDRDVLSAESSNHVSGIAALDEHKESLSAGAKSKKRFVGVRQRPSGRWVAEIKDTTQKIRLWLGTFDSAEEGAKAYDSAARALRGANTRTNFVPAMACEGTVPASKAARIIRLRQMAAASKACEKDHARNVGAPPESQKDAAHPNLKVESPVQTSPLVRSRQDLQQSIHRGSDAARPSPAIVDPSPSPPKPARLINRRHNAPPVVASPKPEPSPDDSPCFVPILHDHGGTVESIVPKLEIAPCPPKPEPQRSITSENLSNAINRSLTAGSPLDSSPSPPLSFPSPRSPFDCMPISSVAEKKGRLLEPDYKEGVPTHRPLPFESSFSAFSAVENFVAPPPIFALEPSRQLFRSGPHQNVISGLVAFSQYHQTGSSCAINRDHVSTYPCETDEVICSGSLRSSEGRMCEDGGEKCVTAETIQCCEAPRASIKEEMDYSSAELYRMEAERKPFILREKEFAELVSEIPWPDYELMDEAGLGLDLSCENSGVYTSAFDFSAEAIDRDSCTSVMLEEHLADDSAFLLRMQYEQSSSHPEQHFQECVLLTEPPELDYSMSPHDGSLPGPPLSPQDTHISSSLLWRLDDASACWDGQSSGSTETTDLKPGGDGGDGGECITSQDHEALWSSMDLTPLCMVA